MQLPKKLATGLASATALASLFLPASCGYNEPVPTTTAEVQVIEDVHYNLVSPLYAEAMYNLSEHIPEYYVNEHVLECSYNNNDYIVVGSWCDSYNYQVLEEDMIFFFKVDGDNVIKLHEWQFPPLRTHFRYWYDEIRLKEMLIDIPKGSTEPMVLVYGCAENREASKFNLLYECPLTTPSPKTEHFDYNINRPSIDPANYTDLRDEQEEGFKLATEMFLISQSNLSENEKKEALQNAARNVTNREMDERTLYAIGFLYGGDMAKVMETYYETGELDEDAYERVLISLGIRAVTGPSASIGEWVAGSVVNYLATTSGQQFLHDHFPVELYSPQYDKEYGGVGGMIGKLIVDLGKEYNNFDANGFVKDLAGTLYDMGVDGRNLCQDLSDFADDLQGSLEDFEIPGGVVEDMQRMLDDVASDLGRDIEKGLGDIQEGVSDAIGDLFK